MKSFARCCMLVAALSSSSALKFFDVPFIAMSKARIANAGSSAEQSCIFGTSLRGRREANLDSEPSRGPRPKSSTDNTKRTTERNEDKHLRRIDATIDSSDVDWWRMYSLDVKLRDDPGKDSIVVHPNLAKAVNRRLSTSRKGKSEKGITAAGDSVVSSENIRVVRKSFDGRWKKEGEPKFVYTVDVKLPRQLSKKMGLRNQDGRLERLESREDMSLTEQTTDFGISNSDEDQVVIVGAGPAGLFAAIGLMNAGVKSVIIERGQPVELRGKDIGALFNRKVLKQNSNLCYGEGGAGTWSDGKLTTRIGKNSEDVRFVLETLVKHGAPERILVDGKPHLGTDKLVTILRQLRADLIKSGVTFMFNTTVVDLCLDMGTGTSPTLPDKELSKVSGVRLSDGSVLKSSKVVLAVGHSARKLYSTLLERGVELECKAIAAGFRIEHPQELINRIQFGSFSELVDQGKGKVPVADYRLVTEVGDDDNSNVNESGVWDRSTTSNKDVNPSEWEDVDNQKVSELSGLINSVVGSGLGSEWGTGPGSLSNKARACYSFCMCPGGQIVPTSVEEGELCINGMSFSRRQSKWANSALVVAVTPEDYKLLGGEGPLRGIEWQRAIERKAALMGGGNLTVPVQRVTDFMEGVDPDPDSVLPLPSSSYRLGVKAAPLHQLYPDFITQTLKKALLDFDKKMPGFITPEALLHGCETRTSSPVQIKRDDESLHSTSVSNLYPAGEGAGYAGGIVSAAVDGLRIANAILKQIRSDQSRSTVR